ncbi:MAG: hypothetical protein HQL55_10600 [Magnetococcales bacterium]|nr:hypothetical protein [Magnetococcales bacterium]
MSRLAFLPINTINRIARANPFCQRLRMTMTISVTQTLHTRVFYLSSHGIAGDYWFHWIGKALNSHPEIMIHTGESVRQKYFHERSRKERPDLLQFTRYLADVGRAYGAVGDVHCYRAYQLEQLWPEFGDEVRFVNLVRHPYCWLHFYVTWRTGNLGMPAGVSGPLDHEWNVTQHEWFAQLGLPHYQKEEVEVWTSYQGMAILNRMVSDLHHGVINHCMEDLVKNPRLFNDMVDFLTHGEIQFDAPLLERAYAMAYKPYRADEKKRITPEEEFARWPQWKKKAFDIILSDQAKSMFEQYGYRL